MSKTIYPIRECCVCGNTFFKCTSSQTCCSPTCCSTFGYREQQYGKDTTSNLKYNEMVLMYNKAPTKCDTCHGPLSFIHRNSKYCSVGCADDTTYEILADPANYVTTCEQCQCVPDTSYDKQRYQYCFNFEIIDYVDIFDMSLVGAHGWRSTVHTNMNPYGVTRDHKVSVHDAIKFGYLPYYIKHPLNCELMLFVDNAKKGKKSSMLYEDLVTQVDEYEKTRQK